MFKHVFHFVFFQTLWSIAFSHSWLHCVDYDPTASLAVGSIRNSFCRAYARGVSNTASFGADVGYNYQPIQNRACRNPFQGSVVTFSRGKTYRMLWPAKNHIAASCTNPFIRDQSLRLYFYPVTNLNSSDPGFTTWASSIYLFYDFKRDGKGFQNCPDACPEVDRLPCFGDIYIPTTLPVGLYKALWVWIFNPNERFTHCFDIRVVTNSGTTKAPTARPTTKAPTTRTPTTRAPTIRAPTTKVPTTQSCSARFQQCGGIGWNGPKCCQTGLVCTVQSNYYSQCV